MVADSAFAYISHNYGNDYGDGVNTLASAQNATNEQNSMGYSAINCPNYGASQAWYSMRNDQVFYFNGHGGAGYIAFTDDQDIDAVGTGNAISRYSNGELNDLALAVFVSCYSANTDSTYGNLRTEIYNRGADTALGFSKSINSDPSNYWSDRFWYRLDESWQVDDSANAAFWDVMGKYLWGHGTDSWTISGNTDMVIDPARGGN